MDNVLDQFINHICNKPNPRNQYPRNCKECLVVADTLLERLSPEHFDEVDQLAGESKGVGDYPMSFEVDFTRISKYHGKYHESHTYDYENETAIWEFVDGKVLVSRVWRDLTFAGNTVERFDSLDLALGDFTDWEKLAWKHRDD
jgi:hypothetical protein